tara:strand:+ start:402 stop:572 length:171 start_codon:yes stop_codon:yes gene_type:complete
VSSSKHKPEMIAAWAKENGIFGYEMYDPRNRENDKRKKSFHKKRFNKSVTFKRRGR